MLDTGLKDFFLLEISKSADIQCLRVNFGARDYLAEVMLAASLVPGLTLGRDETIAELYCEASLNHHPRAKLSKLKRIGDVSIVKVGLFPESIHGIMNRGYYLEMGSAAYGQCYEFKKSETFRDLSNNIEDYSDIIYGAKNSFITNNILELYELWESTKSNFARRRLIALGFSLNSKNNWEQ